MKWRLTWAIRLLEALTMRHQASMAAIDIDDDIALALRVLRRAATRLDTRR
jgi:hypothetical protein